MHPRIQRACVWSAIPFIVLLFGGLLIAGWFPPPSPHATTAQVAHMFQSRTERIRLGALLIAFAGAVAMPFFGVISAQMRRAEGEAMHPLAYIQLGAGAVTVILVTIPTFFWEAAAFDPHRSPASITQALYVGGWLPFIGAIFPALIQNASIALCAFGDRSERPIFPRWCGYANLWIASGFIPSGLVFFFHSGPFAWNGIFTFWLAATIFGGWFIMMLVVLLRAIDPVPAAETVG